MVSSLKMYIAALDEFPDFMTPTLVAHAVLGAHSKFLEYGFMSNDDTYGTWYTGSFKKVVLKVNQKEFDKICALDNVYQAHENSSLEGRKACAVVCPREDVPNVLKFAKLWKPVEPAFSSTEKPREWCIEDAIKAYVPVGAGGNL